MGTPHDRLTAAPATESEERLGSSPRHGPATRLPLDTRAIAAERGLRVAAALLVLPAAIWLLLTQSHWILWLAAVAGVGFGALWLQRARNTPPLLPTENYLELTPEALTRVHAGQAERLAWSSVQEVAIDQDRLLVCVVRESGPDFRLEPVYDGLGLQELAEIIYEHLQRARACTGSQDG